MEWLTFWFYVVLKLDEVKVWLSGTPGNPNGWIVLMVLVVFGMTIVFVLSTVFKSVTKVDSGEEKFSRVV